MIKLLEWSKRYGIPKVAIDELEEILGLNGNHLLPENTSDRSESYVQSLIRLEAPKRNCVLFRNNVGVLFDKTNRPVRFGLANDSKQLNEKIKSADLIGWRKIEITQSMVGTHIAQFLSRECKEPNWIYKGTPREIAQLEWAKLVISAGGDAGFATGTGTI
jgi:hypothetical protein